MKKYLILYELEHGTVEIYEKFKIYSLNKGHTVFIIDLKLSRTEW